MFRNLKGHVHHPCQIQYKILIWHVLWTKKWFLKSQLEQIPNSKSWTRCFQHHPKPSFEPTPFSTKVQVRVRVDFDWWSSDDPGEIMRWRKISQCLLYQHQGSLYYQAKQCTIIRGIPQKYHTIALFDPHQMGNLLSPEHQQQLNPHRQLGAQSHKRLKRLVLFIWRSWVSLASFRRFLVPGNEFYRLYSENPNFGCWKDVWQELTIPECDTCSIND